jgi:hypothetical protein
MLARRRLEYPRSLLSNVEHARLICLRGRAQLSADMAILQGSWLWNLARQASRLSEAAGGESRRPLLHAAV